MKTILFTDTHFGWKQNSTMWLKYQSAFITDQLLPAIKEIKNKEPVRVIHLGDVFDSRSSISTLVATRVVELFKQIADTCDEFYIIGGNHDYYSPNEDSIDTINLLLSNLSIHIVTTEPLQIEDNLLVPWYSWFDADNIQNLIDTHKIKRVFTHADIISGPVDIRRADIYSGHIHIPYIKGRIRNLGSCYSLNFADANTPRGFYLLDDDDKLKFISNDKSINFWKLYNEEIFAPPVMKRDDYIELYINQKNLLDEKYRKQIDKLADTYKNLWTIPQVTQSENVNEAEFKGYDIEAIARELIPKQLKEKFDLILNKQK